MGRRATYRNLAKAFYEAGHIDTIGTIVDVVRAAPCPESKGGSDSGSSRSQGTRPQISPVSLLWKYTLMSEATLKSLGGLGMRLRPHVHVPVVHTSSSRKFVNYRLFLPTGDPQGQGSASTGARVYPCKILKVHSMECVKNKTLLICVVFLSMYVYLELLGCVPATASVKYCLASFHGVLWIEFGS